MLGRALNPGRPTPRQEARPPRAPSCRPNSAQSQLARARAVGLMTGPYGHIHRTHTQWVAGPGRRPQGWAVGRRRAPTSGRPTPWQVSSPHRAPSCRPHNAQSRLARARALELVTGPQVHTPRIHSQWVAGPGRTPQGRAVGRRRAPTPGCDTPRQEAPPPGAPVPPPQRAKPARKSARSGIDDGSPRPDRLQPQPVGSGPWPHAPRSGGRA